MSIYDSAFNLWIERGRLLRGYVPPESDTSIDCGEKPRPNEMKCLVAYRGEYQGNRWALCKYLKQEDQQQAFNLVAACFPGVEIPWGFGPKSEFSITILPTSEKDKSDPTGEAGYVGIMQKRKNSL